MLKKILYPPTYFLLCLIAEIALNRFFPIAQILEPPYIYLGIIPIVLGLTMNAWSAFYFKKENTAIKPFEESTALITQGLYQYSRNPIYLGLALILLGVAILCGAISSFILIPVFILIITQQFIRKEEELLQEKFGEVYGEYQNKVRRWI